MTRVSGCSLHALRQRPQPVARGPHGGEQLGIPDRDGGVLGQLHEGRLVEVGEGSRAAVVDVEQALDVVADPDGHGHLGHGLHHVPRLLAEALVAPPVVRPHGASRGQDEAAETLPRPDPYRVVAFVPAIHPVAEDQGLVVGTTQRDAGGVAAAQAARPVDDALEHAAEIERGVDGAGDSADDLQLATPALGFLEEPGVLLPTLIGFLVQAGVFQRQRRLNREALDQRELVVGQRVRGPKGHAEHAHDLAPDHQGKGHARPDPLGRPRPIPRGRGRLLERRLSQDVVDVDHASLAGHPLHEADRRKPHPGREQALQWPLHGQHRRGFPGPRAMGVGLRVGRPELTPARTPSPESRLGSRRAGTPPRWGRPSRPAA
jgi:hypothetical protein